MKFKRIFLFFAFFAFSFAAMSQEWQMLVQMLFSRPDT